jgi:hypothetical protein
VPYATGARALICSTVSAVPRSVRSAATAGLEAGRGRRGDPALNPAYFTSKSIVCGFRWSITCALPGFGRIVRYATMPSERPLLVTPSVA